MRGRAHPRPHNSPRHGEGGPHARPDHRGGVHGGPPRVGKSTATPVEGGGGQGGRKGALLGGWGPQNFGHPILGEVTPNLLLGREGEGSGRRGEGGGEREEGRGRRGERRGEGGGEEGRGRKGEGGGRGRRGEGGGEKEERREERGGGEREEGCLNNGRVY